MCAENILSLGFAKFPVKLKTNELLCDMPLRSATIRLSFRGEEGDEALARIMRRRRRQPISKYRQ